MEPNSFHKQKLYTLIIAGVALIALILPWVTINFLGASRSWNGFRGWGILSLLGILGVGVLTVMGNKAEAFTAEYKKYAMICFGAVSLGALLFLLRKDSSVGAGFVSLDAGFGLWLCMAAGLAGLALLYGVIKIETKKPV